MATPRKALVKSAGGQGFTSCFHGPNKAVPAEVVVKESSESVDLESTGFGNQLAWEEAEREGSQRKARFLPLISFRNVY